MLSVAGRSLRRPLLQRTGIQARTYLTLKNVKYQATARASGQGRNGHVESDDFKLKLASPKELGGDGKGKNPEQLFAMGYAACFLGAVQHIAKTRKEFDQVQSARVEAVVSLGEPEVMGGFGLGVELKVRGVDDEIIKAAHEFCPYSRALKHGVDVKITKV